MLNERNTLKQGFVEMTAFLLNVFWIQKSNILVEKFFPPKHGIS